MISDGVRFSISFFPLPFIQISTLIWHAKIVFLSQLSRVCSLEAFLICWTENWTWGVRIHLGEGQESLRGKILTARSPECLTLPQYVQFAIYFSNFLGSICFAIHVIGFFRYLYIKWKSKTSELFYYRQVVDMGPLKYYISMFLAFLAFLAHPPTCVSISSTINLQELPFSDPTHPPRGEVILEWSIFLMIVPEVAWESDTR